MMDNLDLYEFHEREQARRESKLPVCDCCGERMYEWYEVSYQLQTWRFCPDCVEHKYADG